MVKDLSIFKNIGGDYFLVDNSISSFMNQLDHGIPIINFHDDKTDSELLDLSYYLTELHR